MHLAWSVRAYRPTGSLLFIWVKAGAARSGPAQKGKSRLGQGISIGHMHRYMRPLAGFCCFAGRAARHSCYAQLDHAPFGKLVSSDKRLFVYTARSKGHILMQVAIIFVRI